MQKGQLFDFKPRWQAFLAIFRFAITTLTQAASSDLDPNFHGPTNALPNNAVAAVVIALTNGQFLVGGTFATDFGLSTTPKTNLARFNADGSIDSNFQPPAVTLTSTTAIIGIGIQSDGKIILSGNFTVSTPARTNWTRLNIDGSVDPGFDAG